jgi:hypothetical protein
MGAEALSFEMPEYGQVSESHWQDETGYSKDSFSNELLF